MVFLLCTNAAYQSYYHKQYRQLLYLSLDYLLCVQMYPRCSGPYLCCWGSTELIFLFSFSIMSAECRTLYEPLSFHPPSIWYEEVAKPHKKSSGNVPYKNSFSISHVLLYSYFRVSMESPGRIRANTQVNHKNIFLFLSDERLTTQND